MRAETHGMIALQFAAALTYLTPVAWLLTVIIWAKWSWPSDRSVLSNLHFYWSAEEVRKC
jgi:hypothetical protein